MKDDLMDVTQRLLLEGYDNIKNGKLKESKTLEEAKWTAEDEDKWWEVNCDRAVDYVDLEKPRKVIALFGGGNNGAKGFYETSSSKAVAMELLHYLGPKKLDKIISDFEKGTNNNSNKKLANKNDKNTKVKKESFWDGDVFSYDLDEHPEYSPEAVNAKKVLRQLLDKKGFSTEYYDDSYKFDEPWLSVERDGISDSFDIIDTGDGLRLMSGETGESGTENGLEKIGYENQDKMNLNYTAENSPENLNRICIVMSKDSWESELVKFVDSLDKDFKVASEILGGKVNSNDIGYTPSIEDLQMNIYEMIQTARTIDKQDKDTNIQETIKAIKDEYPNVDIDKLTNYVKMKAEEIYAGEYDEKAESKKIEATDKLDKMYETGTTELEKAFTTEVKYWLQSLADENSNDAIGQQALSVLDDDAKVSEIVNELVNGSDDIWSDIHLRIEELAGIDYRTRATESRKKVTESVDDNKVNLYDFVWEEINNYDEGYAEEIGINNLDDEDVYNIISEILNRPEVKNAVREEIEYYAGNKEQKITESKSNFLPVAELPEMCYGILPSDNSIIIIKKGESGYYETDLGSPEDADGVVDDLNSKLGVTPEQRFTMEVRSMYNNWRDVT